MKDGYHVIYTVSSNVLLNEGRVAEKFAKRVSLLFYYIFYFPVYGETISTIFKF